MKRITSPRALADTDRLFVFLADKDPRAAQRLMSVLKEAIQSLEISLIGVGPQAGYIFAIYRFALAAHRMSSATNTILNLTLLRSSEFGTGASGAIDHE